MSEKLHRRERQERRNTAQKNLVQKHRGRQRWVIKPTVFIATALFLAAGVGVGGYFLTPHQDNVLITDIEKDEQALIQKKIESLGIQRSEAEVNLWQEVDAQIREAADSQALTAEKKINIISGAMIRSENPFFKDAAVFIDEKFLQGKLATKIDNTPIDRKSEKYHVMRSGTAIINNTFVLTIDAIAEAIIEGNPLYIAAAITHEVEHLQNILRTDFSTGATSQQRKENQDRRILDREEHLAEEARGYMQQSRAVIYHLGLTTEPNQLIRTITTSIADPSIRIHVVNSIRANDNPADPRWKSYINAMGLAD